jgi:hypothetical protein
MNFFCGQLRRGLGKDRRAGSSGGRLVRRASDSKVARWCGIILELRQLLKNGYVGVMKSFSGKEGLDGNARERDGT